jgi:hypothetical protein
MRLKHQASAEFQAVGSAAAVVIDVVGKEMTPQKQTRDYPSLRSVPPRHKASHQVVARPYSLADPPVAALEVEGEESSSPSYLDA